MKKLKYDHLKKMGLADLQALIKFINNGTYDGYSTSELKVEAEGWGYNYEEKRAQYDERKTLIKELSKIVRSKISG